MKYIIKGKTFDFSEEDLDYLYLGEGTEATCYRIRDYENDFVMKIHHDKPEKTTLDKETCKIIKNIDTERIKLPNELIYDEDGNYLGYTIDYVDYKKPKIRSLKISKLVDDFYTLERDIDKLTKNNIYVDDLNIGNTIFSDGIYICDPGSFSIAEEKDEKRYLNYYNRTNINEYEIDEIIFNLFRFTTRERNRIRDLIFSDDEYLSDILKYLGFDKEEKANNYFKQLVYR